MNKIDSIVSIDFDSKVLINKAGLVNSVYFFYLVWSIIRFSFVDPIHNVFYIVEYIRPITFLVDPLIILFFFGVSIFSKAPKGRLIIIHVFIAIILSLFVCSTVANIDQIVWSNYFKFALGYLRFIPFIYVTLIMLKINDAIIFSSKYLKIVNSLMLLQAVITVSWFFGIFIFNNPKIKIPGNPDWGYGLMENTHVFAFCYIILISYGVYNLRFKAGNFWLNITLILIGLLQVVFAESKVNFLTILLSIGLVSFLINKYLVDFKVLIIGVLAFGFLLMVTKKVFTSSSHFAGSSQGVAYFYSVFQRTLKYNFKIRFMDDMIHKVPKELNFSMFGAGPGRLASKFALDNPTQISSKYFVKYEKLNLQNGNSILLTPRTGITAIYGDLGPISFLFYFGIYVFYFFMVLIKFRKGVFEGKIKRVAFIWMCFMSNFLFFTVFFDILYIGFPVFFIWSIGTFILFYKNPVSNLNTQFSEQK